MSTSMGQNQANAKSAESPINTTAPSPEIQEGDLLWQPSPERIAATRLSAFLTYVREKTGHDFKTMAQLHAWSCQDTAKFWSLIWDFCGVIGHKGEVILENLETDSAKRITSTHFFPEARLNFAENLLRRRDLGEALVFRGEDKVERHYSAAELYDEVSRTVQALQALGVREGDRVAAMLPNMPEAVIYLLATTAIGAIWSSCSPDFGARGVLDRFGQIAPKVLIACDGYYYAGKTISLSEKLHEIVPQLPSLDKLVLVDYIGTAKTLAASLSNAIDHASFIAPFEAGEIAFKRLPFNQPLAILYSSGTTGVPKCIVHCAGGVLLQHLKEHQLHSDIRPGDRVFYFTTLGWMMWNWLMTALASEACLLLFDGSPLHPTPAVLFDYAQSEGMTHFGTSAKYIDACRKAELAPRQTHDLSPLRAMLSTGSPLSVSAFAYVYEGIKKDIHLASISGGTDIVSCFVVGDPNGAVRAGEIQTAGLGLAVDVWNDNGQTVHEEKGELVCKNSFPSMPIMFWNDPEGKKYHAAYFERFPGVWHHGDFAEWTRHGGMVIHGRSDATLKPGGVRIGTAEIYAQVEKVPEVLESIAIGQDFDHDVRVVLFVRLREGVVLDAALEKTIREAIRKGASPRHVPAKILAVSDIPRTKSGKITELAVRDVVHGRAINNLEALANPEALALYKDLPALKV